MTSPIPSRGPVIAHPLDDPSFLAFEAREPRHARPREATERELQEVAEARMWSRLPTCGPTALFVAVPGFWRPATTPLSDLEAFIARSVALDSRTFDLVVCCAGSGLTVLGMPSAVRWLARVSDTLVASGLRRVYILHAGVRERFISALVEGMKPAMIRRARFVASLPQLLALILPDDDAPSAIRLLSALPEITRVHDRNVRGAASGGITP